jgi:hypothetical protein
LQEDVDRRTVAVSVKASKLTGRVLAAALSLVLRKMQKEYHKAQAPSGRQTVKKLLKHGAATNTMPLDGETRLFDRVARKYNIDYAFHETEPGKYLLFFKTGQTDAMQACFGEYTKRVMAQAKQKQPPIREQLQRLAERVRAKPRERERVKEMAHGDR